MRLNLQSTRKFHLVICIFGLLMTGCGAGKTIAVAYDAAFPDQPVAIDDVMVLDVMNLTTTSSEHLDGNRLLNRYELSQPRQFTCRIDENAATIRGATLFDDRHRPVANLSIEGKPTEPQPRGHYTLEVISVSL